MKRLPGPFLNEFNLVVVENDDGGFVLGWNVDVAWICPRPIPLGRDSARDHARRIGDTVLFLVREEILSRPAPVFRRVTVATNNDVTSIEAPLASSEERSAAALLSFIMLQRFWPAEADKLNADRELMGLSRIDPLEA